MAKQKKFLFSTKFNPKEGLHIIALSSLQLSDTLLLAKVRATKVPVIIASNL